MCKIDCIELFNNITHDVDGNVNKKIFEKIMTEYEQYVFIKGIVEKDTEVNATIVESQICFTIRVTKKKIYSKILKKNDSEIKHKKKKYGIHVTSKNEKKNILELFFIKID
jgi:hypothetical protein